MNGKSKFKTLVIIDLETTGLIDDEPKITELAMIAVNIETLEEMKSTEKLPRVINKFIKYFDPVKSIRSDVAELTGLNNQMLKNCAPFHRGTVLGMEAFLSDLQKPICFVAHNGNKFDFPLLFCEIQSALSVPPIDGNTSIECISETCTDMLNNNISLTTKYSTKTISDDYKQTSLTSIDCADSVIFFRQMNRLLNDKVIVQYLKETISSESSIITDRNGCNNNNVLNDPVSSSYLGNVEIPIKYIPSVDPARQQLSMKLVKIYEREFTQETSLLKSHHAEDDCLMLLAILKRYLSDWLEWIEINHQPLSNFSSLPLTTTTTNVH